MSFLFGGGKKTVSTQQPTALGAIRFQTSVFGLAIPIVYGTNRVSANVIWYGDFVATPHTSGGGGGGGGGGKGGGGGGGSGGGQTTYTYNAAVEMALAEGSIGGVGKIWQDKTETSLSGLGLTLFTGTYPQTPWGYLAVSHATGQIANLTETKNVPGGVGPYTITTTNAAFFQQDLGVVYGDGAPPPNPPFEDDHTH